MNRFPYVLLTALVVGCDRWLKTWAARSLAESRPQSLVGNVIRLTRVHNPGGAFGIFRQNTELFIVVSSVLAVGLLATLLLARLDSRVLKTGLALVLGGAVGNVVDRLHFGYVLDFFEIRGFPVFNLADASITVGAGLILLIMVLGGDEGRSKGKTNSI